MKTLNDYMFLPYRLEIVEDQEEGGYVVSYPDLPGCITCGDTIEKTMYEAANTSLSVTKKDQSLFDYREYKEIKQAKGYTLYYEGLTQPRNLHVIEAQQSVKRDDLSDEYKNVMSYLATNQTKSHALFKSGNFVLKESQAHIPMNRL